MQMTDREMLAISEQIRAHVGLIEKYSMYSQMVQDPEMRQLIQNHHNILQGHLNNLRSVIQPQTGGSGVQPGFQAQTGMPQGVNQPGYTGRGSF